MLLFVAVMMLVFFVLVMLRVVWLDCILYLLGVVDCFVSEQAVQFELLKVVGLVQKFCRCRIQAVRGVKVA